MGFKSLCAVTAVGVGLALGTSASAAIVIDDFSEIEGDALSLITGEGVVSATSLGNGFTRTISVEGSGLHGFWGTVLVDGVLGLDSTSWAALTFTVSYESATPVNLAGLTGITLNFSDIDGGIGSEEVAFSISLSDSGGNTLAFTDLVAEGVGPVAMTSLFADYTLTGDPFDFSNVTGISFAINLDPSQGAGLTLTTQADGTPGGGIVIIPEPASLALMAIGGLMMIRRR